MTSPNLQRGDRVEPCPFCGEDDPHLVQTPANEDLSYDPHGNVRCFGCGASGPIRDAAGQRADAIERWNTRQSPEAVTDGMIEAGRQAYSDWQQSLDPRVCSMPEAIYKAMRDAALLKVSPR